MIRKATVLGAVLVLFGASTGHALAPSEIDMTIAGRTYTGADLVVWTNLKGTEGVTQPSGTGIYDPFLREIATGNGPHGDNGVEIGLNTDATIDEPYDNVGEDPHTHSVLMGDMAIVTVGGVDYFSYTLDLNEPANGQSLLSLDRVMIWTTPNAAGNMLASVEEVEAAGDLVYDMDGTTNQTVWLDYCNSNTGNKDKGSGEDDMEMLIPVTYFGDYAATDYMYFYAKFGSADLSYESNAGFEEWRFHQGENNVPEPISMFLFGGGIVGLLAAGNRKK